MATCASANGAAWSLGLLGSGDGLEIKVILWAGEFGCYKLCIGEFGSLFLGGIRCSVYVISVYTCKVLAIDVDETANGKQCRENVGHNRDVPECIQSKRLQYQK